MTRRDLSIVLGGEAGQGIQSIQVLLLEALKGSGLHVFATSEFMSRVRGGENSTLIRVSDSPVAAFVERIDILVALSPGSVPHLGPRVGPHTLVIGEAESVKHPGMIDIPFGKIAMELGSPVYSGVVAVGFLSSLLGLLREPTVSRIAERFIEKGEAAVAANRKAFDRGFSLAEPKRGLLPVSAAWEKDEGLAERILVDGSDAVALGALAGGCNYACGYPMSPGTGVLTALAGYSRSFDILVEQVEDEIGVINMALGAWYAGARAIVSTSGGGFALMTEGISLSGMIETPVVVHVAQRPGPATGLPTRTEQGDLNLVRYAGHGNFPRAIYAPGDLEEAFRLSQLAFDIADKTQSPAFILTDQYLVDSSYDTAPFDLQTLSFERHIIRTDAGYKRYALSPDGLSPRGIPGYGEGFVRVDSDEHDEDGRITEDLSLRVRMVDKRLAKGKLLSELALPPSYFGPDAARATLVCWGSTKNIVLEAVAELEDPSIAVLHFSQVWPLHPETEAALKHGGRLILVENDSDAAFGSLLAAETGIKIDRRILKYSGLPFSVEELAAAIKGHAEGGSCG